MNARFNMMENEWAVRLGKRFAGLALMLEQSTLPKTVQFLVQIRASQINGCGFCIDMHTKDAAAAGETPTRLNLIAAWRESTVFTEAERVALAFTEEGTRMADTHQGVSDETWAHARKHYDEEQLTALVILVSFMNSANRLNIITQQPAGDYEVGQFH